MPSRLTHAQIREAAKVERDIEVAAFLDAYADLVDAPPRKRESWEKPVNELRYPDEVRRLLTSAIRGLAGSIRAGLVDDGMPG